MNSLMHKHEIPKDGDIVTSPIRNKGAYSNELKRKTLKDRNKELSNALGHKNKKA